MIADMRNKIAQIASCCIGLPDPLQAAPSPPMKPPLATLGFGLMSSDERIGIRRDKADILPEKDDSFIKAVRLSTAKSFCSLVVYQDHWG